MPSRAARTAHQLPGYAELICRSNFSFLTGASQPEELVARAQALGYAALAITDECSLSGVVRAHCEAKRLGMPLIVGALMHLSAPQPGAKAGRAPKAVARTTPAPAAAAAAEEPTGPHLAILAQTRRGYSNLAQWITVARRRAAKGSYVALMSDVEGRVPNLPTLAGLPDCLALLMTTSTLRTAVGNRSDAVDKPHNTNTAIPIDLRQLRPEAPASPTRAPLFETLFAQALWLKTWFGPDRCALALPLLHGPHDALLAEVVQQVATLTGLPIVAVGDVLMHTRSRKPLQDVLSATRLRCTVGQGGFDLQANAEAHLRARTRLASIYRPEWLAATLQFAGRCVFSLDELRYEYPEEIVPPGQTPTSWLRELTEQGVVKRFPAGVNSAVRATLEHELALIAQLKYEPYFLTVADLVHWARSQGILCQGRGSAANSAVCYCLGVTEVDPARMSLLFERFISAERNEPPDIDIDFEHQRREEVIQYVYRKYGRHRAALTGVVISYRPRSALRDVGRALGIDQERIDGVAKSQHWWSDGPHAPSALSPEGASAGLGRPGAGGGRISVDRLRENGFDPESSLCRLWVELTQQLIGFPRHLSQHPGGFVIAREDLSRLVPVENAAMPGRSVIQWDKDDLDALGLLKVDLLALGMLSAIRRALNFVGDKLGRQAEQPFVMQEVPAEDAPTYQMLCEGDSVGTFQVESRAQMSMLPRLQPRCFYDLVIEVAIVRPGPIQGGMVHPYLRRRSGEEAVDYPSSEVRQALSRTLGVPIFQEQVMQLAILAADFTPGEADQLRRAMAAWKRKGGLGPFHERLVGRMVAKGYELAFAERIFKQIEGFGEYGFPESHAASFALLVYVSAWLKRHHPDAFLAALLNSQPMGFYAPAQLVRDAKEHSVVVLPVDVTLSGWESGLERSGQALWPVRMGLNRISGLQEEAALRVVAARHDAPFVSPEDLARRAQLDAHQLSLLAQADALVAITGHRHQAAWAVAGVDTRATPLLQATRTFEDAADLLAPNAAQTVLADYHATGLSLTHHPVALLRGALSHFKVQPASVLRDFPSGRLARASGIVTHRQRPETAKGVVFVTLEDETGAVNVIVWPKVAEAQRRALLASTLLTVYGVWQSEGEVRHLIAKQLIDHSLLLQGLATTSRNFR